MASPRWDLVVIGGGTAGIIASRTAAAVGAKVVLVERGRMGGDCLWEGCVPSKALIAAAHHAATTRRAPAFGIGTGTVEVAFAGVMSQVRRAIRHIELDDSPAAMQQSGVVVLPGTARFTGPRSLEVDGRPLRFDRAVIAAGASPTVPPVPGLAQVNPLTSRTIWDLTELPAELVVLGGGSIGCELGQSSARLGRRVTLIEFLPRILSREDPDAAGLVYAALERDGVRVLVGHRVTAVTGDAITVDGPDGELSVSFDRVLAAAGRRPNTAGLGLDAAGIEVGERGHVEVDSHLRTTNPRVWAAGDVTPLPPFTHTAGFFASLAATNAVLGLRRSVDLHAVPRVTFTDPEVAAVGAATWTDAEADGAAADAAKHSKGGTGAPRTVTRWHSHVDRAVVDQEPAGFSRLALGRRSRIVGATVVSPRAGEALAELTLAVRKGLTSADLGGTIHAYPTYADGPWNAAIDDARRSLTSTPVRIVTRLLRVARRIWPMTLGVRSVSKGHGH